MFQNPLFVGAQLAASPSFEEPSEDSPLSTPSPGPVSRPVNQRQCDTPPTGRTVQNRCVWLRENQLFNDAASPQKTAGLKDTSTALKELRLINGQTGAPEAAYSVCVDQLTKDHAWWLQEQRGHSHKMIIAMHLRQLTLLQLQCTSWSGNFSARLVCYSHLHWSLLTMATCARSCQNLSKCVDGHC